MSCNVCNKVYQEMWLRNEEVKNVSFENCPDCEARPRHRVFKLIFEKDLSPMVSIPKAEASALAISAYKLERGIISEKYGRIVTADLFEEFDEGTVKTDIRDLKEFEDESFDFAYACCVIDFVPEVGKAFSSVYRILKKGGIFLFHVMPPRLRNDSSPPKVKGYKKEWYYPGDAKVPSIIVGKKYLLDKLRQTGFKERMIEVTDIFSGIRCTWFMGVK